MTGDLFSIRMRAAARTRHVSGAERITAAGAVNDAVRQMLSRAMGRPDLPDEIVVTVERLSNVPVRTLPALDMLSILAGDLATCRDLALRALEKAGVTAHAATSAIAALDAGPSPSGRNMRGAVVMDAATGERLEPDPERGIRVSRFDWSDEASAKADEMLSRRGLTHFRTKEALALATKVAMHPRWLPRSAGPMIPRILPATSLPGHSGIFAFPDEGAGPRYGRKGLFRRAEKLRSPVVPVLSAADAGHHRRCRQRCRIGGASGPDRTNVMDELFEQELGRLEQQDLLRTLRRVESCPGASVTVDGRPVLLLCSNDYLGLAGIRPCGRPPWQPWNAADSAPEPRASYPGTRLCTNSSKSASRGQGHGGSPGVQLRICRQHRDHPRHSRGG